MSTFRLVLAPAGILATLGVLLTATLTAPMAVWALGLSWTEGLLIGSIVASTDAAAVFFLLHAKGLRLRPRVSATLEVESATNDPIAIFMTILLVEILLQGAQGWGTILGLLAQQISLGTAFGVLGGYIMVWVLNRLNLPQGLHAPFVATGGIVIFALTGALQGSGFLAVYLAGLVVGNNSTRAHNMLVTFMDAVTWLAQIAMFVLLGLLAWPDLLLQRLWPALLVAGALTFIARPATVFLCLAPFRFSTREKLFVSWVGLRGSVGVFLASIPLLVGLPGGQIYFDVAFVIVLFSLLVQGWTIPAAARKLRIALPRVDVTARRVELDLPGQLEKELVGYPVIAGSPYLRHGLIPNWARPTLIVRNEEILTPVEADPVLEGDYVYLLAPPEKAQALDRFFVNMPVPAAPDPRLLGDFFVPGTATLGALSEIYGLQVAADHTEVALADYFTEMLHHPARTGDIVQLGPVALLAHKVENNRVTTVGLRLAEPETPNTWNGRVVALGRRARKSLGLS